MNSYIIEARNVNEALARGIEYLLDEGVTETSRNGKTIVAPGPVITEYANPLERVLFNPKRDANPFFHLMESLWMLAGRNDVDWPKFFNARFVNYSDDGTIVHGAYGYRWRKLFDFDQIRYVTNELNQRPDSRRAVISMWDPRADVSMSLGGGKDVPCNTHAYFDLRGGKLNMTVCCRSNDVIWGAYGANAVHFSFLQEYVAAILGVDVGTYYQVSNNFHAYLDVYDVSDLQEIAREGLKSNRYTHEYRPVHTYRTIHYALDWTTDLLNFMNDPNGPCEYREPFFRDVVWPMYMAWYTRKAKEGTGAAYVELIKATDWKIACREWIERREAKDV